MDNIMSEEYFIQPCKTDKEREEKMSFLLNSDISLDKRAEYLKKALSNVGYHVAHKRLNIISDCIISFKTGLPILFIGGAGTGKTYFIECFNNWLHGGDYFYLIQGSPATTGYKVLDGEVDGLLDVLFKCMSSEKNYPVFLIDECGLIPDKIFAVLYGVLGSNKRKGDKIKTFFLEYKNRIIKRDDVLLFATSNVSNRSKFPEPFQRRFSFIFLELNDDEMKEILFNSYNFSIERISVVYSLLHTMKRSTKQFNHTLSDIIALGEGLGTMDYRNISNDERVFKKIFELALPVVAKDPGMQAYLLKWVNDSDVFPTFVQDLNNELEKNKNLFK